AASGFATMLADKYAGALEDAGRHYVDRIQASTRKLARLVDDLRALVSLPQLSGHPEAVDLADLSAPIIAGLRSRYPDRSVTVEMGAGEVLLADRTLLGIALASLLDNAWKFTARKPEGWIKLGLLPRQGPDEVVLQVSDNGTGFDPAYTDQLFTAFQRLHSAADFPGNGLGLAIVKKVAERHGGRAWAETSATGASFFMALPQDPRELPA
ncbi:MAG: sensor signal transduction histidine kinase, partial [Polaromonas sp.]|nr:sensor signal transduction histidine kinase [Polaromonas sp.]